MAAGAAQLHAKHTDQGNFTDEDSRITPAPGSVLALQGSNTTHDEKDAAAHAAWILTAADCLDPLVRKPWPAVDGVVDDDDDALAMDDNEFNNNRDTA